MWASGRYFDEATIGRIQAAVDAEPQISRRALSRQVCDWMEWRSPNGALQEMSARKALGALDREGVIHLPAPSRGHAFERPHPTAPTEALPIATVQGSLEELGPIELVAVSGRDRERSRLWNGLLDAYHELGAGPLCGAQLRYLVGCERYGWLGAVAFSSATWRLAAREQWIGWSDRARRANLGRVILNSRFLVLPTVEVPNLASHVLGQALGQVGPDWSGRYGVEPVLVETFVDPQHYRGTSYQAANWIRVGETAARQAPYPNGKGSSGPKDIYLYPLRADAPSILCTEPERRLGQRPRSGPPQDWAEEEFGRFDAGDRRLGERLGVLARDFFARPTATLPEACQGSEAKVKAAYRFCKNPEVDMQTVLTPHVEATVDRIRDHPVVLAVQDTSDLNYTHHPGTEDLGPLQSIDDLTVGLKLHDTMVFTPEGMPLGLLDVQCWARDGSEGAKPKNRPIEDKESAKWLHSYRRVAEVQRLVPETMLVSMGDREADIYELFQEALADPKGPQLLVRSERSRQRQVEAEGLLWPYMARKRVAGFVDIVIPRKGSRPARNARLAVRFGAVRLQPPKGKPGEPLSVWAVYAHEVDYDPQEISEPLKWMLLTTVPTTTFDEAWERLRWYAKRWGIEVFHRVLKSGCRIEDRQLRKAERLTTCLAIDMVVAWRIHWLTYLGRETPDIACDVFLAEEEWKALCAVNSRAAPPDQPPTAYEAIRMIAKLGGFLGRKSDGFPGPTTLWRGLERLADIVTGWRTYALLDHPARAGP
jgi:hypothetical protein